MKTAETKSTAARTPRQRSTHNPFFVKEGTTEAVSERQPANGFFPVQPKLIIGAQNDPYEQEAERTADKVVREVNTPSVNPVLSSPVLPAPTVSPIQKACEACEEEKQEETPEVQEQIQRKPIFESSGNPEDDDTIQTKSESQAAQPPTSQLESQLNSSKGGGSSLPTPTRQRMESAFGTDFSQVRVHTDSRSQQMNQNLGAKAFAHGKDIYFNRGQFQPDSQSGQHLLAHELTHTIQQGGASIKKAEDNDSKVPFEQLDPSVHEFSKGKIEKVGGKYVVRLKNLLVKTGSVNNYLGTLPRPISLPKPRSRKKEPTNQKSIWQKLARPIIETSLSTLLDSINTSHSLSEKKAPKNKYMIQSKASKGSMLTGTFTQLKNAFLVPPWGARGKPESFQIEHIVDYQIAGKKADHKDNLMLLAARNNIYMGQVIKGYIRNHIDDVLKHYNKYLKPGELTTTPDAAREYYDIKAESISPSAFTYMMDVVLFKEYLGDGSIGPLSPRNSKLSSLDIKEGHFVLKSNKQGVGITLPYSQRNFKVGSFMLTTNGDERAGTISEIKATPIITGKHTKSPPEEKTYSLTPSKGEAHTYKANNFGHFMQGIKLKYLSPIEFSEPEIDEGLNIRVKGTIQDPTVRFLKGSPIEVELIGTTLTIRKTYSLEDLGNKIGPFTLDRAYLTLYLDNKIGLAADGGIDFSIDKVGEGNITAGANKNGFFLQGSFKFIGDSFDSKITVRYDSSKDKEDEGDTESPWTIKGSIEAKDGAIKGVKSAKLEVSYEEEILKGQGKIKLAVPKGIEGGDISFAYGVQTGAFVFIVGVNLKGIPGLKDGRVEGMISSGDDDPNNESGGNQFYFSINTTLNLDLQIPGLAQLGVKPKEISALYESKTNLFEVKATIEIEKSVFSGSLTIGVSNRKVDEEGNPLPGQTEDSFYIFGFGELEAQVAPNFRPRISAKLTQNGEVILNAGVKLTPPLEIGTGYKLDQRLFGIDVSPIPIFSIGVGTVKLTTGGSLSLYAQIEPLKIGGEINMEGFNLNRPEEIEITAEVNAGIRAEAGLKINAYLGVMATAVVLYVEGRVNGDIYLGAAANASLTGGLSWSPEKGFQIDKAEANLLLELMAKAELSLKVFAGIDYWIGRKSVWDHTFPLASKNFPGLGELEFTFPISMEKGEMNEIKGSDLKAKNNPLGSGEETGKYLQSAVTGEGYTPKKQKLDDHKPVFVKALWDLPAIGPSSPEYSIRRGRYLFIEEMRESLGADEVSMLSDELYSIEREEFRRLREELLQADYCQDVTGILSEFSMNHTFIGQEEINKLSQEVEEKQSSSSSEDVCYPDSPMA
ncbi:MAG: DUF4157 domain-containing protein [Bacteroidota bacterium]